MRRKQLFFLAFCFSLTSFVFAQKAAVVKAALHYGKYGCTASKYNNGSYEFLPKGSFVLTQNGTYTYNGFAKPSSGKFTVNAATGVISFSGGYFDKGTATPMEGRANRYYLVFPTIPDNRWTCGLIAEKK